VAGSSASVAALDRYRTALELDWGADERRFAGEPDQIRERLGEVVEQAVAARRSAATAARDAGDWYVGAEQYEVATEEVADAREQFELALALARDQYPDAVDHLTVELEALEKRVERATAARDGEELAPAETDPEEGDPACAVEATIGTDAGAPDDAEDSPVDAPADPVDIETRLRELSRASVTDVVDAVLSETGWTTTAAESDRYDLAATKETPVEERMLVSVAHRPDGDDVDQSVVERCATLRGERPDADSVMVATSGSVSNDATRHARRRQVRLLDDECLSAVIEARELEPVLDGRRVQVE